MAAAIIAVGGTAMGVRWSPAARSALVGFSTVVFTGRLAAIVEVLGATP